MDQDGEPLKGTVEADETYVGGKRRDGRPGPGSSKVAVFGMVERQGRVVAKAVPDAKGKTLIPLIAQHIMPRSIVYTDEWKPYRALGRSGYFHDRIHHASKVHVSGDVHTNTIEGFWSLVKRGIGGVYHVVSAKHLQGYLNEYAWRYNHRNGRAQFETLLLRAASR
ncbi:MAG: IS1595 family transposase [Dehalococcoidia bacterium]|nr:IS1595 family transposase [Dehalococcoidia bacterium]